MSMVCPQCNGSFEQRLQCPTCRVRLLYQADRRGGKDRLPGQPDQWQHTPWGRIMVGLLLAQGLYHGMRQLCSAGMLAAGEGATPDVWATLFGLMLLQGLQGCGILVGGTLAGAGQRRGMLIGTLVGLWNGVIFAVMQQWNGKALTTVTAYGQPVLLTAFGALGGLIGSLIWRPLPALTMPDPDPGRKAVKFASRGKGSLLAGPVAWGRVLLGVAVTVGGTLWAHVILNFVLEFAEGKLTITSRVQAQLVTTEICVLVVLLGSCLAGATTVNGLKQGICVGLVAAAVLIGIQMGSTKADIYQMIYTGTSTFFLSLAGGWFGGQLFPPVINPRRGKKFHPASAL